MDKRSITALGLAIAVVLTSVWFVTKNDDEVQGSLLQVADTDVTTLKTIRRKAQTALPLITSLTSVSAADKAELTAAEQGIIDKVNALLTPSPTTPPPTTPPPTTPPPGDAPVVAAAGDIAGGDGSGAGPTGDLVRRLNPDMVLTLGDAAQHSGTLSDYMTYYDPHWGSFKAKTFPTVGNHDYQVSSTAQGYSTYFNTTPDLKSRTLGGWLLVSVNSAASHLTPTSQVQTLLANDSSTCEIAFWHRPRWSSGTSHGSDTAMQPLWEVLANNKVDLLLSGHDHVYERFSPKNATGGNVSTGTRQFVVGMGGSGTDGFKATPESGSQVRLTGTQNHGVLKLTLKASSYDWAFVRASDNAVLDSGSTSCT